MCGFIIVFEIMKEAFLLRSSDQKGTLPLNMMKHLVMTKLFYKNPAGSPPHQKQKAPWTGLPDI